MRVEQSTSVFIMEMQEAHCFFILAVQAGLLYDRSKPMEAYGAPDWHDSLYTRSIMKGLTVIAALPALLYQMILYKLRLDSAYSLSLCTIVFIMSYVASETSLTKEFDTKYIYSTAFYRGVKKCGDRFQMRVLCTFSPYEWGVGTYEVKFHMQLCLTALILLWVKKLWTEFAGTLWLSNYAQRVSKKEPLILLFMIQLVRLLTTMFIVILEIIFTIYIGLSLPTLYHTVGGSEFTIGQMVAVLIWAPPIAKFIYLLICE
jgi:hypothetical protein